jgi:hypothetical protein
MNPMSAQNIISHRMFVAALSHDEREGLRKRSPGGPPHAAPNGSLRPRASVASESPGAVAQQLLLLSDAIEAHTAPA